VDRPIHRIRVDGIDLDSASPRSPRYNDAELQWTWYASRCDVRCR
jgi:hypothetical protein